MLRGVLFHMNWRLVAFITLFLCLCVNSASAMNMSYDSLGYIEIQPNVSAAGYYNLTNEYIVFDELIVNSTSAMFVNLSSEFRGAWNYVTGTQLCAAVANCTVTQTGSVIQLYFNNTYDTTPPDVNWIAPAANGTEAANKTYIEWNISVSEAIGDCYIEINGTNQTGTQADSGSDSYCYYNQTGLTSNRTHCAFGYASDAGGNFNRTIEYICRDMNYQVMADVVPATVCQLDPFWTLSGLIGFYFHDCE